MPLHKKRKGGKVRLEIGQQRLEVADMAFIIINAETMHLFKALERIGGPCHRMKNSLIFGEKTPTDTPCQKILSLLVTELLSGAAGFIKVLRPLPSSQHLVWCRIVYLSLSHTWIFVCIAFVTSSLIHSFIVSLACDLKDTPNTHCSIVLTRRMHSVIYHSLEKREKILRDHPDVNNMAVLFRFENSEPLWIRNRAECVAYNWKYVIEFLFTVKQLSTINDDINYWELKMIDCSVIENRKVCYTVYQTFLNW